MRDVDLSTDDVSRLRQAWCATLSQAAEPLSNSDAQREGTCIGLDSVALQDGDNSGDDVRLVFAGKDLQKGRPLSGYGIGSDSTVHVLGRLRGGAQLGKVVKGRSQVRQHLICKAPVDMQQQYNCFYFLFMPSWLLRGFISLAYTIVGMRFPKNEPRSRQHGNEHRLSDSGVGRIFSTTFAYSVQYLYG